MLTSCLPRHTKVSRPVSFFFITPIWNNLLSIVPVPEDPVTENKALRTALSP